MANPFKKEASEGHNAKLRRMTRHYGAADPAMNKASPDARLKQEGSEDAVEFGADSSAATARGDRPARRSIAANPVATYRKGGAVKARARGGRLNKNKGTHVNVIVAPQGGGQQPVGPANPALGLGANPALPGGAAKPPMPAGPMPGGPMGATPALLAGAPGGMAPGMMPPRKRGGRVNVELKEEGLERSKKAVHPGLEGRASGGAVKRLPSQRHHMTAGAVSGEGRLEKIGKKGHNAGRPQAV